MSKRPARTRTDKENGAKRKGEIAQAELEIKKQNIKQQTRERVRKYRQRKQAKGTQEQTAEAALIPIVGDGFDNRTSKKRATDKVKGKLPPTPKKKAEVIEMLASSPRTRKILTKRGLVKTSEEQKEISTLSIFKGDTESWLYPKCKVRQDAISEEDSKVIFNYWTNTASRPTGDKKDVVKKRIGKQQYVCHTKHVLEKTQTEVYLEFQPLYPDVKINQRKFESLKPFFVKQAKERDRRSCLCRKHVETKIVFDACMKFCKAIAKETDDNEYPVLKTLTEATDKTLCPKQEGKPFHNIECVQRECDSCGVNALPLLPEETSAQGSACWSRYEYVSTGKFLSNGQDKKKIALIQKDTPPAELFKYFKELLVAYPNHSFIARWQCDQLDNLLDHLPLGHLCVHDYSKGYACRQQDEIQSEYFDIAKVSLHVTILHHHAVQAIDGVISTEEEPHLIKEHVFVISDDPIQDHDSVHKVQELIHCYLVNDVGCNGIKMHGFTGCAAQYKSRHCIGDLSCSLADLDITLCAISSKPPTLKESRMLLAHM